MALNYFRLVSLALLAGLYFYGFSNSNSQSRATRAPTPISNPVIMGCSRANNVKNILSFGFNEGVSQASAELGKVVKSLPGAPTAIFFWIDQDVYAQNDKGYAAALVEAGHAIGLRWNLDFPSTKALGRSKFLEKLIASSTVVNGAINKFAAKQGKYFPKYLSFNYADSKEKAIRDEYAVYAAELGFYTIGSEFLPESRNEKIEAIVANYQTIFKEQAAGIGTFSIAIHPGNQESGLTFDKIKSVLEPINSFGIKVVSFQDCIQQTDVFRTGICYLFRECVTCWRIQV